MTLAAEDTNSIPTDNANMAIQVNVAMQMTQPGDWWLSSQPNQVVPHDDQI